MGGGIAVTYACTLRVRQLSVHLHSPLTCPHMKSRDAAPSNADEEPVDYLTCVPFPSRDPLPSPPKPPPCFPAWHPSSSSPPCPPARPPPTSRQRPAKPPTAARVSSTKTAYPTSARPAATGGPARLGRDSARARRATRISLGAAAGRFRAQGRRLSDLARRRARARRRPRTGAGVVVVVVGLAAEAGSDSGRGARAARRGRGRRARPLPSRRPRARPHPRLHSCLRP